MVAAHNDKTSKPIPVLEQPHRGSHLEEKFLALWTSEGGPHLERELVFAKPRRWRFDFAWPSHFVALEIDGAIWTRGAHGRGSGIARDQEKGNAAAALGWRVLRVEPKNYAVPSTFALIKQTLAVKL